MLQILRNLYDETVTHQYLLPNGIVVTNQKDGCDILGIGMIEFHNQVKNGSIKKLTEDRPNGYEE